MSAEAEPTGFGTAAAELAMARVLAGAAEGLGSGATLLGAAPLSASSGVPRSENQSSAATPRPTAPPSSSSRRGLLLGDCEEPQSVSVLALAPVIVPAFEGLGGGSHTG